MSLGKKDKLKGLVARPMDMVVRRTVHDISAERQRQALVRTAAFVEAHMAESIAIRERTARESWFKLLELALDSAPENGLVLQFGVASGTSLRFIARRRPDCHGFDSFQGMPEYWRPGIEKGHFAQDVPDVEGAQLHVGWFEETVPPFFAGHADPIAFMHLDADLYSSTKTVLDHARENIVAGTIIVFDEYFNGIGWEQHEHRAFMEFIEQTGRNFEYVAYMDLGESVMVRITG